MWFLCSNFFLVLGTQVNDSLPSNTIGHIVGLSSQYTMVACISFVQWNVSNVDMVGLPLATYCWAELTVHHGSMNNQRTTSPL